MKIVEITSITPWRENKSGTSALQYHLLVDRPEDIDVDVWTYNFNNLTREEIIRVEEELRVKIHVVDRPWWVEKQQWLRPIRVVLKYPMMSYLRLSGGTINEIDEIKPDGVWIYGEELLGISNQMSRYKRVHTFPDAESLYYERLGGWKRIVAGSKYRAMERAMDRDVKYHLVGEEDVRWFEKIALGVDARFIRHPHYELKEKEVKFGDKIKLLIAGKNNLYMKGRAEEMIDVLDNIHKIDGYEITFLGKGWSEQAERLKRVGYQVRVIEYAGGYVDEVIRHDVQITPISVGTGTKGKVLDALSNGVLVVGTEYALENIVVGGVLYNTKEELKNVLIDILNEREKYEGMAMDARDNVRRGHNRHKVSAEMFDLFG